MWINRRLIWFFEQAGTGIKHQILCLKNAFVIVHIEPLSTAFLYFDTSSIVTYVTGHSSCAVVMTVERKLSVAYSATFCGEMRLYYDDIANLSLLSVVLMQASSLSFTCFSKKATETIKKDPREYP